MNRIYQQLQTLDPVRTAELAALSSHPVFDELFDEIMVCATDLPSEFASSNEESSESNISFGGHEPWRGRRRSLVTVAVGVAVLLFAGAFALQLPGYSRHSAPRWRLVGDVTSSWRTLPGSGYEPGLYLACPTRTTCYADLQAGGPGTYSQIEVTHDGGTSWKRSNLPVTPSGAIPLSCVNAETCATVGSDRSGDVIFLETTDGGATWTAVAGPSGLTSSFGITLLSCTTSESCIAVESDPSNLSGTAFGFVTSNGGTTWTASSLPPDFLPIRLQCTSNQRCILGGFYQSPIGSPPVGAILFSSDDGAVWNSATAPPGLGPLNAISCADSADCVANFSVGDGSSSEILTSADGGESWSAANASVLPGVLMTGLSCPTTQECWASGTLSSSAFISIDSGVIGVSLGDHSQGIVASTSDGGRSWQSPQLAQGVLIVLDVSCPSVTNCYALAVRGSSAGSQGTFVLLAYGS